MNKIYNIIYNYREIIGSYAGFLNEIPKFVYSLSNLKSL